MSYLTLIHGQQTLVDEDVSLLLCAYDWYLVSGYATRSDGGQGQSIALHREIMGLSRGQTTKLVDHINGDKLDNRRINLRVCTRAQNAWNSVLYSTNTSGYKGVYPDTERPGYWRAAIRINGKPKNLGRYKTKEEAACAYERAVKEHRDEYSTFGLAR